MCLFANASVMGADPARFQTQSLGTQHEYSYGGGERLNHTVSLMLLDSCDPVPIY